MTALLLSRGDARGQEVAIRLALGATRPVLVRTLLMETLVLASAAGLASLYLVQRLPGILMHWLVMGREWPVYPDWRVFVYLAAITLLAGGLAGLAPAVESLRVNVAGTLKDKRSLLGSTGKGFSFGDLLIAGQVAASLLESVSQHAYPAAPSSPRGSISRLCECAAFLRRIPCRTY